MGRTEATGGALLSPRLTPRRTEATGGDASVGSSSSSTQLRSWSNLLDQVNLPGLTGCRTVLVLSDGTLRGFGNDAQGRIRLPPKPFCSRFVQAAAGYEHTVVLAADGSAIAFGDRSHGKCELPVGRYVQVAAGWHHSLLLSFDGKVTAVGKNDCGQCDVPELPSGKRYTLASGGWSHSILLRSDGGAEAFGFAGDQRTRVPPLPPGGRYVHAAAGAYHSLYVRADGAALAAGRNDNGQCDVPPLPEGRRYVQAAAGVAHSVLIRDDGLTVCFGCDSDGQCKVPEQLARKRARAATAGDLFTVVLLDDGTVCAFGLMPDRCDEASVSLAAGVRVVSIASRRSKFESDRVDGRATGEAARVGPAHFALGWNNLESPMRLSSIPLPITGNTQQTEARTTTPRRTPNERDAERDAERTRRLVDETRRLVDETPRRTPRETRRLRPLWEVPQLSQSTPAVEPPSQLTPAVELSAQGAENARRTHGEALRRRVAELEVRAAEAQARAREAQLAAPSQPVGDRRATTESRFEFRSRTTIITYTRRDKGPDSCQICMEDFEDGDCLRLLKCMHHFHASCVDKWLAQTQIPRRLNPSCPSCRTEV